MECPRGVYPVPAISWPAKGKGVHCLARRLPVVGEEAGKMGVGLCSKGVCMVGAPVAVERKEDPVIESPI